MNNIMLDLETLGNSSNSAIIAIGAVKFAPGEAIIGDEYYELINPKSCTTAGLTIDADTVMWWMKRSLAAKSAFSDESKMRPLEDVLRDFSNWVGDHTAALVWGNGSNFDNVILANAYKAVGIEQPWPYWGDRCYRTVASLRKDIKRNRVGIHHNALHDAFTQARHLIEVLEAL